MAYSITIIAFLKEVNGHSVWWQSFAKWIADTFFWDLYVKGEEWLPQKGEIQLSDHLNRFMLRPLKCKPAKHVNTFGMYGYCF